MSSSPTTLPQQAAFILSVLFLQGENTSLDPPPTHLVQEERGHSLPGNTLAGSCDPTSVLGSYCLSCDLGFPFKAETRGQF